MSTVYQRPDRTREQRERGGPEGPGAGGAARGDEDAGRDQGHREVQEPGGIHRLLHHVQRVARHALQRRAILRARGGGTPVQAHTWGLSSATQQLARPGLLHF